MKVRPMTLADYNEVHLLWTQTEGLCLGDDDNRDGIKLYLDRNQGLCFVATSGGRSSEPSSAATTCPARSGPPIF